MTKTTTIHSETHLKALDQIDLSPLTRNQKSLIALAVAGNVSEFFDMFIIGFAVSSLLKDPALHLQGFEAGWILAMSGLGTVIGAVAWVVSLCAAGYWLGNLPCCCWTSQRRACATLKSRAWPGC